MSSPARVLRAALAAALAAACAEAPSSGAAGGPPAETPATLLVVEDLDEEGGVVSRSLASEPAAGPFFREGALHGDARALLGAVGAGSAAVGVEEGTLWLDGAPTGIPAEVRGEAPVAPLRPLAERFGAYLRVEETPGAFGMLWPAPVLCRYARGADRRAEVFLEAAERGLLARCEPPLDVRVRRWASASPGERWAASVTFEDTLRTGAAATLLGRYGAAPFGALGTLAGHPLVARVEPDAASGAVLEALDREAVAALERTLCGLPGSLERRAAAARPGATGRNDLRGERHMLAAVLEARRRLPEARAGAPIVVGVDVIGEAAGLRRLAADPRVEGVAPGTWVDGAWVVEGPTWAGAGIALPEAIVALDSASLLARLHEEAARAPEECGRAPPPRGR